jgi:hypothetical protein
MMRKFEEDDFDDEFDPLFNMKMVHKVMLPKLNAT